MDFIYYLLLSYWTPIKTLHWLSRPLWSWVLHCFHVFSVQLTQLTSHMSMSIHLSVSSLSPCLERVSLAHLYFTFWSDTFHFFLFWVLFVRARVVTILNYSERILTIIHDLVYDIEDLSNALTFKSKYFHILYLFISYSHQNAINI